MRTPVFLRVLAKLLLAGVALSMLFRTVLFLLNAPLWSSASTMDVLRAFLDRGLLFDLYVHCMLLAVPALILTCTWLVDSPRRWPVTAARWIYAASLMVLLAISCMDIPFYRQFNFRITRAVFTWADTPWQSLKEVFSTPVYLITLIAFVLLSWLVVKWVARIFRPLTRDDVGAPQRPGVAARIAIALPTLLLLAIGMRGDWDPDDTPLTIENAYFCDNPFLNQLGVNAGFSLIDSFNDAEVRYMEDANAVAQARTWLGIHGDDPAHPFARTVVFDSAARTRNVVLIIVESLSAERMAHCGNDRSLTPFLDSLADRSLFFDRFYSAGVHTHNGVFSTLYGWPTLGDRPSMAHASVSGLQFHGLPQVLKANGYRTAFFYVGEKKFDNMSGFLPNNGFDAFFCEEDYDAKWPRTSWGVADHALYVEGLAYMDSMAGGDAPFFTTFLTIASHIGYNVPTDVSFRPASDKADENIYQYTDRMLADFFHAVHQRPWGANTVFVITGDHGQAFDRTYEMPLSYHHIPLIIDAPDLEIPRTDHRLGGQIDVPATVLGLLRIPHVNNTLGIDLTREHRRFAFFSADAKLGAVDQEHYWMKVGEREQLYHWPDRSTHNEAAERPALADSMRSYAESMTQAARWAIENKVVGAP